MLVKPIALVAGGSGYFGSILCKNLFDNGWHVRILDVNSPKYDPSSDFILGDIRDQLTCETATKDVKRVFHNVAQVPLAKNKELLFDVNVNGTEVLVNAAKQNGVKTFVYTSSSAVFGIPDRLPITNLSIPKPVENYGEAKLLGEDICRRHFDQTFSVIIVRPRTILGMGRLGIFSILFNWVRLGLPLFVLGSGNDEYQFIHAHDLANGIVRASDLSGLEYLNLGAISFGSFKEDLDQLCIYADTKSSVVSLPDRPIRILLTILNRIGLLPFASYQLKLYCKKMYFDSSDWAKLNYEPQFTNVESLIDSYDWYLRNQGQPLQKDTSHHQKPVSSFSITVITKLLRFFKSV
jgi:nucleoside-diphosphate-sugar epimerase